MPSAVLLSILIPAGLFLLAGMLVVFTVVKKQEVEFEPPKAVERPKMRLKKPKVKIRKSSRPKPIQRIVTKMERASMPEIQPPEMSGMGDGLGGGGGDMMPDFDEVTVFGSGQSIGNDLEGTFYDLKRDPNGRRLPPMNAVSSSRIAQRPSGSQKHGQTQTIGTRQFPRQQMQPGMAYAAAVPAVAMMPKAGA